MSYTEEKFNFETTPGKLNNDFSKIDQYIKSVAKAIKKVRMT